MKKVEIEKKKHLGSGSGIQNNRGRRDEKKPGREDK